jgi:FkbM family methyltransferase
MTSASAYIDELVKQDYRRHPIEVKRTHGFEILLNPNDSWLSPIVAIIGTYEPDETRLFKRVLRSGSKVIDVGANLGWFTLLAATVVGRSGLVISLEPEPKAFSSLVKSVQRNGFKNVIPLNQAASDVDGAQTLFLHRGDSLGNSIVRNFGDGGIPVASSTLDNLARAYGLLAVDLVKVDAEGAEPEVIAGMRWLIDEGRVQHMILEWNPREWGPHQDLLRMLFEKFEVFAINRLSLRQLTRVTKDSIPPSTLNLYLAKR